LNVTEDAFEGSASEVIFFQNKPVLKEVMETVEAMANRIYGPRRKRKPARKKQRKLKHAGNENDTIITADDQH